VLQRGFGSGGPGGGYYAVQRLPPQAGQMA
jgi:hypothetical protein